MNLIQGVLQSKEESLLALETLEDRICKTLKKPILSTEIVIAACDRLSTEIVVEDYIPLLLKLDIPKYKVERELQIAKEILSRPYLEERIRREIGTLSIDLSTTFTPRDLHTPVSHRYKPLGTILHIVAGNVDALPIFSVIEGLLTGNINILKLPGADNGLSIKIIQQLLQIEPLLTDYIYVFDFSSKEIESIQKMANLADAIALWGSDDAIASVRKMASPTTKIIEWGHKISFAYVSGSVSDEDLEGIAYNICDTNQLFCSSCQGIYLDTDSYEDVLHFARRFLPILHKKAKELPTNPSSFLQAQKTLESYTEKLESLKEKKKVFRTRNCGIIAYNTSNLLMSYMFRYCWVKPLPRHQIIRELRPHKNHLQTVGLACEPAVKAELVNLLSRTGVVRIPSGKNMSVTYCGMPHDGEYSLLRYMKIVSIDI